MKSLEPKVLLYQIGDVAKRAKVSLRTLRFYQQKGLIAPSARTPSGMSLYSDSDVNRVKFIRRLKNAGMSLKQITTLLDFDSQGDTRAKVFHTLEVLKKEALSTRQRIADLEHQSCECQEIIGLIETCLNCGAESCPDTCQPKQYLL